MSTPPLIAIVDDDEAVREALSDLLLVEAYAAETFRGAIDFLNDPAPDRFACLITDVRMPEMDGIELVRRLRQRGSTLPVIVITSLQDEAARARAMAAGATAWFTKPFSDDALFVSLRAVLRGTEKPGAST
ncbi:FixJ family two-component response regulator [Sphingomonas zeicaulis]|uniref:response regulator transcription factor n=1 Tax=Sphingomonas zeicaulis TaxID=1632740 RepID=UPI003D1EF675